MTPGLYTGGNRPRSLKNTFHDISSKRLCKAAQKSQLSPNTGLRALCQPNWSLSGAGPEISPSLLDCSLAAHSTEDHAGGLPLSTMPAPSIHSRLSYPALSSAGRRTASTYGTAGEEPHTTSSQHPLQALFAGRPSPSAAQILEQFSAL